MGRAVPLAGARQGARAYCRDVKITVTGGFTPEKIREFEENGVPADVYGVGSSLFSNSTEDGTNWRDMAKVGRAPADNPALQPVARDEI